ncbi:unnamed protein product [Dovyalis caffra]|uniref:Uncharacterized protein n=1 Tax=Dovyalis caffra TaxID=77055 RepID=A0AAV1QNJ0_9ROSI|nr:unnamed protein product [Dovyalis caffra]
MHKWKTILDTLLPLYREFPQLWTTKRYLRLRYNQKCISGVDENAGVGATHLSLECDHATNE